MDLSFLLATSLLVKIYALSVLGYGLIGAMVVQNDQDTTFGRKPLPWKNNPVRWCVGAVFVALLPVLNTVLCVAMVYTMLFNPKRDRRLQQMYASKWGDLS